MNVQTIREETLGSVSSQKKKEENAGQASLPFFFLFLFCPSIIYAVITYMEADFPQINQGPKCKSGQLST